MDPKDFQLMLDSMVQEIGTALANCQVALAQANAQIKIKDRIIGELTEALESATQPAE